MAISSLVVRAGIGAWGDIAHLITRGLDIGAVADRWTPAPPDSQSWNAASSASDIWTPATPDSQSWTPQ